MALPKPESLSAKPDPVKPVIEVEPCRGNTLPSTAANPSSSSCKIVTPGSFSGSSGRLASLPVPLPCGAGPAPPAPASGIPIVCSPPERSLPQAATTGTNTRAQKLVLTTQPPRLTRLNGAAAGIDQATFADGCWKRADPRLACTSQNPPNPYIARHPARPLAPAAQPARFPHPAASARQSRASLPNVSLAPIVRASGPPAPDRRSRR